MNFQKALNSPVDYSLNFDRTIELLNKKIYANTGLALIHDKDMNYFASQKLIHYLNNDCEYVSNGGTGKFEIDFLISSKSNLFTIVYLSRIQKNEWHQLDQAEFLAKNKKIDAVKRYLIENGYEFVDRDDLNKIAEGHFTELDNKPATLFEALFSEMY